MSNTQKSLLTITTLIVFMFSGLFNQTNAKSISLMEEIPFSIFVPCANDGNGEMVEGTFVLHIVITTDKDANVTKAHFQPQVSNLEGMDSGNRYNATGVTQEMLDKGAGANTYTYINRFHFVGEGIQYYQYDTVHVTVNANGEVTADVSNTVVECK
jgi:hypothetical protein